MRVKKKTPNQDDFRVLLVGVIMTTVLYFIIAPVINKNVNVCLIPLDESAIFLTQTVE
jgi:hypothetical protein